MNPILDTPEQKTSEAKSLRRSLWICTIYGVAILSVISFSLFRSQLKAAFEPQFLDGLVTVLGLVFMGAMLLSPAGFFFAMKAFKRNEGTLFQRIFHTVLHVAVFLLLVAVILIFFFDIFSLYNR